MGMLLTESEPNSPEASASASAMVQVPPLPQVAQIPLSEAELCPIQDLVAAFNNRLHNEYDDGLSATYLTSAWALTRAYMVRALHFMENPRPFGSSVIVGPEYFNQPGAGASSAPSMAVASSALDGEESADDPIEDVDVVPIHLDDPIEDVD